MKKEKKKIVAICVSCFVMGGVLFASNILFARTMGNSRSASDDISTSESTESSSDTSAGASAGSSYSPSSDSSYSSSYSSSYGSSSSSGSSYDSDSSVGAGGYEMPNESDENFSDYIKRVDPELYDSITNRYDSLTE